MKIVKYNFMYLGTFSYSWLNLLTVPKRLYFKVTASNTFIWNKKYREFILTNTVEFFLVLELHLIACNHIKAFHGDKEPSFCVLSLRTGK